MKRNWYSICSFVLGIISTLDNSFFERFIYLLMPITGEEMHLRSPLMARSIFAIYTQLIISLISIIVGVVALEKYSGNKELKGRWLATLGILFGTFVLGRFFLLHT